MGKPAVNPLDAEIEVAAREHADLVEVARDTPGRRIREARERLDALRAKRRQERALELAIERDPRYPEKLAAAKEAADAATSQYEQMVADLVWRESTDIGGKRIAYIEFDKLDLDVHIAERQALRARVVYRDLKRWPARLLLEADTTIIRKDAPKEAAGPSLIMRLTGPRGRRRLEDFSAPSERHDPRDPGTWGA